MSTTENTKLCDFTSTNNNDFICTPIAPTASPAAFYEIKPALLNLVIHHNAFDFNDCNISEVIMFLQKLARSPNASAINMAFTKTYYKCSHAS